MRGDQSEGLCRGCGRLVRWVFVRTNRSRYFGAWRFAAWYEVLVPITRISGCCQGVCWAFVNPSVAEFSSNQNHPDMPEGPEIYRAAAALDRALANKRIEVALHYPPLKRRAKRLRGTQIVRVYSRSKAMLTEFDNGDVLYSHNQLYGEWQIHGRDEPLLARQVRLIISTTSQRAVLYSATEFAWLNRDRINSHPYIAKLGPEVLAPEVSVATVASRLSAFPRRVVADALLDQAVIAGLGNYLRADALFVALVDPFARIGELSNTELQRLALACIQLTRRSVEQEGVVRPLREYRHAMATATRHSRAHEHSRFYVFDREGLPCWRCGAEVSRVNRGGRGVFFCARCQGVNTMIKPK